MGTKVQYKSAFPGYCSMRDLNEDCNSFSWPPYYGDKTLPNGQYYNGVSPRAVVDACQGYDKDILKQTMLEHEHIFKDQVHQLHRLYRIQRDMMDEIKMKERQMNHISAETSLSSSPLASQVTFEDARRWHIPSFPLVNSVCARPSISGCESSHTPLSFMKGSTIQDGSFPSQNGGSLKSVEVVDYRPAKVRRKMIDLQLPADEYIDTEEENRDTTITSMSSLFPNGNDKVGLENGPKLFLGDSGKSVSQVDPLTFKSSMRSTNTLADLNEPVQVENTTGSVYVDLLGKGSSRRNNHDLDPSSNPDLKLLDLPNYISVDSHHRSIKMSINNQFLENKGRAKGFLPHVLEAELGKSYLKSASQGSDPEKFLSEKAQRPPTFLPADESKVDLFRGKTVCDLEISERNPESSSINPGSAVTSSVPSSDLFTSPGSVKPWPHPVSYWEKPYGSLSQNPVFFQAQPFLSSGGSSSKNCAISIQSNGFFGRDLLNQNGFCHGSSSGSKESAVQFTSASSNHLHSGNSNGTAYGSSKLSNSSDSTNMKVAKGMNLNIPLSNGSPNALALRGLESDGGRKQEGHLTGLPWLRAKPASKNENSAAGRDLHNNETSNSFIQKLSKNSHSVSCSSNVEVSRNIKMSDCLSNEKILGAPIFERNHVSKEHSSQAPFPFVSISQPSGRETENIRRNRLPDINLPCDDTVPQSSQDFSAEVVFVQEADTKVASFRQQIDLNLCATEEGSSFVPSVPDSDVRMPRGIDLEALPPLVPESEDDAVYGVELLEKAPETSKQSSELNVDESVQSAAEAIVAISSYGPPPSNCNGNTSETSSSNPLNWFVEVVVDIGNGLDTFLRSKDFQELDDSPSSEEIDDFELMTLQLAETTEEDYMPKPLVPENFNKLEEAGTSLLTNNRPTRKGQGRRGRQRRDFQRDILPGLASLSRHEVTEDLQTFGGLMRATGHLWHSGLTRRNATRSGSGRGRRRSITSPPGPPDDLTAVGTTAYTPINNIQVALEGWGKAPRRPRRQRCPAGNPPSIALT